MNPVILSLMIAIAGPAFAAETANPTDNSAPATEQANPLADAPSVSQTPVTVPGLGEVTLKVSDFPNPEPVDTPVMIEISLKCIGSTLVRKVGEPIMGCAFDSARYDTTLRALVIHYKRNVLDPNEGVLKCSGTRVINRRLTCSAPTAPANK